MSRLPVDVVEVRAWGQRVGAVALDRCTGWYAFGYAGEWVDSGVELAPLHMPLRTEPYQFPELSRETFYGLPALLADSLPDTFGNALVNAWMAAQGIDPSAVTPLDRLVFAADRAMGALEFRPPAGSAAAPPDAAPPDAVLLADLVLAARLVMRGEAVGDEAARAALRQLVQVGTSAGGARAKAVVAFNPSTYQIHSAYGPATGGFEPWIVKLDGVSATGLDGHGDRLGSSVPYGRVEYAYHLMALACGVEMTPCRLLAEGPRRHFMTRRFDRGPAGERVHMVSLCALAHMDYNLVGTHSYDQYLQEVTALGMGTAALGQAFRRMVFNVLAVNHDDHTKNVAFVRPRDGSWALAPAFDLTHAYRPGSRWTGRHLMAVNGRFEGITRDDLYEVGERHHVPGYRRIVSEVAGGVARWPDFAAQAELDDGTVATIAKDLAEARPG